MQIGFMDDPSAQEIQNRIPRVKELLHVDEVLTASEFAEDMTGMAETLESVRLLILIISLIITILITVLIGHSFVTKERGDIAILKAIGFQNTQILFWQSLRFVICCILSTGLALLLHLPLMKLAINPIFTMMGAEFGIQYEIRPLETYCIYPGIFLAVTSISAFLTAQHTRTVQTNECSNID
jgi:putative ABC transport system permease protein